MTLSENEDDEKKPYCRPDPLCLFCHPYEIPDCARELQTYIATDEEEKRIFESEKPKMEVKWKYIAKKGKQEMWLRRRTEVKMKRRKRQLDSDRHLKTYLLMSVKPEGLRDEEYVPGLVAGLETENDAWQPNKRSPTERYIDVQITEGSSRNSEPQPEMEKLEKPTPQVVLPVLDIRRSSLPENVMRKYSLRKSSEEIGINQNMPERTLASPSEMTFKNSAESVKRKMMREKFNPDGEVNYFCGEGRKELKLKKENDFKTNKFFKDITNLNESFRTSVNCPLNNSTQKCDETIKRTSQDVYDKLDSGIIKLNTKEKGSQTGRFSCPSETTPSAKEDTEGSYTGRSGSLPCSSPIEIARSTAEGFSSSGNLSSESEDIKCTCFELISSKDTSTDVFNSGNSTLSQTVSQKSLSTQDSTVSINSVSTGGSTTSVNSNSTSPDNFGKTSAKETTSPEYTSRNRKRLVQSFMKTKRNIHYMFKKKYSKFHRRRSYCVKHYRSSSEEVFKMIIEDNELRDCNSVKENVETVDGSKCVQMKMEGKKNFSEPQERREEDDDVKEYNSKVTSSKYKWAQCTPEEIYMMQRMRHRKFIENYRRFSIPLLNTQDAESLNTCAASGSSYRHVDDAENSILIPRYSALPRTLSMLVNTSSDETSAHNSDSDSHSLADSLEEFPVTRVHHISHDTKKELKPVRGDVNFLPENKRKLVREYPRSRAFFISIKEPFGEDELLSSIEKIPEPPNNIKDRINKRQMKIITRRKAQMERNKEEKMQEKKKRRIKGKNDTITRTKPNVKMKGGKIVQESLSGETENKKEIAIVKKERDAINQKCKLINERGKRLEIKDNQDYFTSRIPVCEASTSTSTSSEKETPCLRKRKSKKGKEPSHLNADLEVEPRLQKINEARTKPMHNAEDKRLAKAEENSEKHETWRSAVKTHGVIHPPQMPFSETIEFYRRNKQSLMNPNRTLKFRQRFEVIPEEKSSSLSSTEENRFKENLKEASLSVELLESNPTLPENFKVKHLTESLLRRYSLENVSNLIFAKLMAGSMQPLPALQKIQDSSEPIIVLSPKDANYAHSRKGRDALIAMNREDFNRLSKGWKNFYMLKENSDESDNNREEKQDVSTEKAAEEKEKEQVNQTELKQRAEEAKKEQCGGVKTSELFLVEKPENDLMCNNSKEDEKERKESVKYQARTSQADSKISQPKEGKKALNDNLRSHFSKTVLKPIKVTPKEKRKNLSLPEVRGASSVGAATSQQPKNKNFNLILPKVSQKNPSVSVADCDGMDSDSTVYCQPPSLIVPRLAFDGSGGLPSDGTFSSSSSGTDETDAKTATLPLKHVPLRKRGISQKMRHKRESNCDTARQDIQGYSGWSVTVAGPLELARAAPELEMRLSFPASNCGPPQVSQSDSGFAEDGWQNASLKNSQRSTVMSATNIEQGWTVTVKNPHQEKTEGAKQKLNKNNLLPDLGQTPGRNMKKVLKSHSLEGNLKNCLGKISIYWPKVILTQDEWTEEGTNEELSVRGSAVPLEKKPRPQTMTERDLTKGLTSRNNQSRR